MHPWHSIELYPETPAFVPAVIEIPRHSGVKYELNAATGLLATERTLPAGIRWPDNYGFIPQTYGDDGDPLDIFVLSQRVLKPLAVVRARPVGVIHIVDRGARDSKIIAVDATDETLAACHGIKDIPPSWTAAVLAFCTAYKNALKKDVVCNGFGDAAEAYTIIGQGIAAYRQHDFSQQPY